MEVFVDFYLRAEALPHIPALGLLRIKACV